MKRAVLVLGLSALVSCDDEPAIQSTQDLAMTVDEDAGEGGDMSGEFVTDLTLPNLDFTMVGDAATDGPGPSPMPMDLGAAGDPCTTACDCMPGLACFGQQCTAGVAAVYCCQSPVCPGGSFCQNLNGSFSQCGNPNDMAGFDPCPFVRCNGGMGLQRCMQSGCSQCMPSGGQGNVCAR